jgi:serine phosphatase RsbU (regulator of sigma subunit)
VLSDGLGSGIKAGVLSTLTATMALKFVASDIPPRRAARIIMNTLPVCRERGISYATFTLIDIEPNAATRIIEYDNPATSLFATIPLSSLKKHPYRRAQSKEKSACTRGRLDYSTFTARAGDRLVFFSDGVPQAGMGTRAFPLGWGEIQVCEYVRELIASRPQVSARELARSIVFRAQQHACTKQRMTSPAV